MWWTGDVDKALNLAQDIDLPEEQVKLLTGEKTALAGEAQRLYELSDATESDFDAPTPWVLTSIRISVLSASLRV